mgnify:CR=1 FL=1
MYDRQLTLPCMQLHIWCAFFVTFSIGTALGHGAGIEASPLIFTNDREVKVTVELLPADFYKSDQNCKC